MGWSIKLSTLQITNLQMNLVSRCVLLKMIADIGILTIEQGGWLVGNVWERANVKA